MDDSFGTAAYGGEGWQPRARTHRQEIGTLWAGGIDSEWADLRAVLLRAPGPEIAVDPDTVDSAQYLEAPDPVAAADEHAALAEAFRAEGVRVLSVPDVERPTPNRMFCADLFVMTPEGAILARPASAVRAGEEVAVAAALAEARVPILRMMTGAATFEGADLMWLDQRTAVIGLGLRTNVSAAEQIGATLGEIGVTLMAVDLPFGTMHLMGTLRIPAPDLAIAWPRRTPHRAVQALRERGYRVAFLPDFGEAGRNAALNFVTLGPRRILMPGGNARATEWYESLGLSVIETPMDALRKAAGAVGCLTGIVTRSPAP